MRRIRRRWLVLAAIVLLAGLGGFLAVRWALDPQLLRTVAQSQLSAALGQPVHIGTVRLSFFPTPNVYGTDIGVGAGAQAGGPSLEIRAIRLHPRLSTIFRRPIVIDRVEIEGLALTVRRDANGRWLLPLPQAPVAPSGATSEAARLDVAEVTLRNGRLVIFEEAGSVRTGMTAVAPIQDVNATLHREAAITRLNGLTASVGRSKVAGEGSLGAGGLDLALRWTDLRAGDLPLVFALLGTRSPAGLSVEGRDPLTLHLRVDAGGQVSASGRVAADRAALGTLAMTSFQSPIDFAGSRLTLGSMAFRAYSGTGRGRLAVNTASVPISWGLNADLRQADIDAFLSANTPAKGKVSGTGTIAARLQGTSRAPVEQTVAGTVAVDIANGVIHDFPLLSSLYSALKLGGGDRDLRFQTLSATFGVADARATTNDLVARTGELTLTSAGTIAFDQTIAMTGTATFSAARSDAFVHSIRELSALKNASGEVQVPFTISGSVAAPRFSIDVAGLLRRGLENQLKQSLGDRLKGLLKKKK